MDLEEFKKRLKIYSINIPRQNWFTEEQQISIALEAEETARKNNCNFFPIFENLIFMRSFEVGYPSCRHQ
ncbi:MAG: hypothetical protein LLG04_14495 [Parachlamydia sp.]|nr:hypothetical protein [Parachlamydia sp.]